MESSQSTSWEGEKCFPSSIYAESGAGKPALEAAFDDGENLGFRRRKKQVARRSETQGPDRAFRA
jgi:hypothetical protein